MKTTTYKPLEKLFQVFFFDLRTTTEYCWIIKADNEAEAIEVTKLFAEENGIIGDTNEGELEATEIDLICLDTHTPDYPETIKAIREATK